MSLKIGARSLLGRGRGDKGDGLTSTRALGAPLQVSIDAFGVSISSKMSFL